MENRAQARRKLVIPAFYAQGSRCKPQPVDAWIHVTELRPPQPALTVASWPTASFQGRTFNALVSGPEIARNRERLCKWRSSSRHVRCGVFAPGALETMRRGVATPKRAAKPRVGPSCKGKIRWCGRHAQADPWPAKPDRERLGTEPTGVGPSYGRHGVSGQRRHPHRAALLH